MILTPTIPKHPETRYGVTHSQYAHLKEKIKEETHYFMSLSCKGEDHSEIEIEFQKELDALSNGGKMFYHGGLRRIIKIKMGKLLPCVDQPERTSILQVGDHNVTF